MPYHKTNEPGVNFEFYQGDVTNTGATVCAGKKCNLWTLIAQNDSATKCFLQFFDAANISAVTVGTTVPVFSVLCPPNVLVQLDRGEFPIKWFKRGMAIAATTTRTGSTAPSTALNVTIHF